MTNPEVRVLIEVTLVSEDGFYSVSKFTPEMWEHDKEQALRFAHEEHVMARSSAVENPARPTGQCGASRDVGPPRNTEYCLRAHGHDGEHQWPPAVERQEIK